MCEVATMSSENEITCHPSPSFLSLPHTVSEIWIEEIVCQSKATCLNCLDGGNIFLFFLTVMMLIQFLPSSPGHVSHLEIQTFKPTGTYSLLTDTSAARAVGP